MDIRYVVVVRPSNDDVLVCNNKQLPIMKQRAGNISNLGQLCSEVEATICCRFQLIFLRAELEFIAEAADVILGGTIFHKYESKLLMFEAVSEEHASAPDGFHWMLRKDISKVQVNPLCSRVEKYLYHLGVNGFESSDEILPYSTPGWFSTASKWIKTKSKLLGYHVQKIEQVSKKGEGCVLRILCDCNEVLFFKEVGPNSIEDEVKVTVALSEIFPGLFCEPLCIDERKNWILMKECGKPLTSSPTSGKVETDFFGRALTDWTNTQMLSLSQLGELKGKGIRVEDGNEIMLMVGNMLSHSKWRSELCKAIEELGTSPAFSCDELDSSIRVYTEQICVDIAQFNVPFTLVHGDLVFSNIVLTECDKLSFIDHGSMCISFPFRDAVILALDSEAAEHDLEFYYRLWEQYESVARLRELYKKMCELNIVLSVLKLHKHYVTSEEGSRASAGSDLRSAQRQLGLFFKAKYKQGHRELDA